MYRRILVPLDGSELAECILPHVEAIAKGCGVHDVVFLRVVEPFRMPTNPEGLYTFSDAEVKQIESDNRTAAGNYLSGLVKRLSYNGATINSEVVTGRAAESIVDYATRGGVDLITIATHGRSGVSRWVMGSVADRVIRSAPMPVLIVRPPGCTPGVAK